MEFCYGENCYLGHCTSIKTTEDNPDTNEFIFCLRGFTLERKIRSIKGSRQKRLFFFNVHAIKRGEERETKTFVNLKKSSDGH